MGKQFSKKVNAFDKETYEANQQAVKALKAAGMSQIAIAQTLKMSQSTVNAMLHKTYEEYDQYRKEKYAKRQAVINGQTQPEQTQAPDQTEVVAKRLTAIEEQLAVISTSLQFLEKVAIKKRFF